MVRSGISASVWAPATNPAVLIDGRACTVGVLVTASKALSLLAFVVSIMGAVLADSEPFSCHSSLT
jgi:hypothetical protein